MTDPNHIPDDAPVLGCGTYAIFCGAILMLITICALL